MNNTELTYAAERFPQTAVDNTSRLPESFRTQNYPERPSSDSLDASESNAAKIRGRDYEIVLGFPGKLEAQSMEWTLTSQGQVRHVRSINDVDELIAYVGSDAPRVLLLDEQFGSPHLQSIARQLPVRLGDCHIALFADRLSCRQLHMASPCATGLLSRNASVKTFLSELDTVADGRRIISESLSSRVKLNTRKRFEVVSVEQIQNLTNRQLEVLVRVAQGMTAKEAAHDLHITEKAVESHKYRLMRILGVRDRIELCRWAIREGIIAA